MTIDEAIKVLHRVDKCNKEHYDDCCGRCCEDCEYYYDDEELGKLSLQIVEWLEELKAIKELDLDIPQHFTKEQSDWIKAYVILKKKEAKVDAIEEVKSKMISFHTDAIFRYGVDIIEARADAFEELEEWIEKKMKEDSKK